eukprot:747779-Hanusia_phi.AAC.1
MPNRASADSAVPSARTLSESEGQEERTEVGGLRAAGDDGERLVLSMTNRRPGGARGDETCSPSSAQHSKLPSPLVDGIPYDRLTCAELIGEDAGIANCMSTGRCHGE